VFEKNIEAYILLEKSNRRYFLGIDTSFGCVVLSKNNKVFITDSRYSAYAEEALGDSCEVVTATSDNFYKQIAVVVNRLGVAKVGVDENNLAFGRYDELKKALRGVSLFKCGSDIALKRAVKTQEEIDNIVKAQGIAEKALKKTVGFIKAGITERELRAELIYACLTGGADNMSFEPIVAFGANSGHPHHRASDKRLEKGDAILIDFGCIINGYCSDLSRTFCLGEPNPDIAHIYEIVKTALGYAVKHIKAGMTGHEVDSLAREYIVSNGYDTQFGHGLGHGVGLDIHEMPRLGMGSKTVLEEGMVVTIEPGIYLAGIGGVRIEDMVVVEKDGCRVITEYEKELRL